jgi:hypothetical protein
VYDAVVKPITIIDRLVLERFPDVSLEIEPAYMLLTLRAIARFWLASNLSVGLYFLRAKEFSLDSELVLKEATAQVIVRLKVRSVHMAEGDSVALDTEDGHVAAAATPSTKAEFDHVLAMVAKLDAELAKLTRRLELWENVSQDSKSRRNSPRVAKPREGRGRSPAPKQGIGPAQSKVSAQQRAPSSRATRPSGPRGHVSGTLLVWFLHLLVSFD